MIPGFTKVADPIPGDIVGFLPGDSERHGHMGIVVGAGLMIYAGEDGVKIGSFGENLYDSEGRKRGWTGRRYTGR